MTIYEKDTIRQYRRKIHQNERIKIFNDEMRIRRIINSEGRLKVQTIQNDKKTEREKR